MLKSVSILFEWKIYVEADLFTFLYLPVLPKELF